MVTCDQHVGSPGPISDHHTYLEVRVGHDWWAFDPVLKVLGPGSHAGDRLPEKSRTTYDENGDRLMAGITMLAGPSQRDAHGAYTPPHHDDFIESFALGLAKHMGVSREQAYEQLMHGYHPDEHKALIQHHAAAKHASHHPFSQHIARLHGGAELDGVAMLGKWDPGKAARDFFAKLDPTNPKAPIGQLIRKGLVMAGSAIGIPVGPLLDGLSNMGDHGPPPRPPNPPPPLPVLVQRAPPPPPPRHIPPPPGMHHEKGGKGMSTGVKALIGGGVVAAIAGGAFALTHRKKNPRKKKRGRR